MNNHNEGEEKRVVRSLTFTNDQNTTIDFVLEPWGEIYEMKPADVMRVSFSSVVPGEPDISVEKDAIVVYGWQQSVASVWRNGEELAPHKRTPVPQATPELSARTAREA